MDFLKDTWGFPVVVLEWKVGILRRRADISIVFFLWRPNQQFISMAPSPFMIVTNKNRYFRPNHVVSLSVFCALTSADISKVLWQKRNKNKCTVPTKRKVWPYLSRTELSSVGWDWAQLYSCDWLVTSGPELTPKCRIQSYSSLTCEALQSQSSLRAGMGQTSYPGNDDFVFLFKEEGMQLGYSEWKGNNRQ